MRKQPPDDLAKRWVPVSGVAQRLSMSVQAVYNLIANGHLKAIRVPGTGRKPMVRVSIASVEALERDS